MIHARSESAWEKPAFRNLMVHKRCLIVADGFYEWQKAGSGKIPYRIVLTDRKLFGFAGLYDTWRSPNGTSVSTCTILTTRSNRVVAPIHDRMPVMLSRDDEAVWLGRHDDPRPVLEPLLGAYPADSMRAYPVSAAVGDVRQDGPERIQPA